MLKSIQLIKKVYNSGDNPVLVECNDLNDYVGKHNRGQTPANKLFAEWICHSLLEACNVSMAPKELIEIQEHHVLASGNCQPAFFKNVPCFGTLFLEEALEWSQFDLADAKLLTNKEDLITIAFFDIWLANEDRNWNNFNLLTNPSTTGWEIVPIDHGACFNSLSFNEDRPLYEISCDDSLIYTDEFRTLVKPVLKTMKDATDFADSLYIRILGLKELYDEQVRVLPVEWKIKAIYSNALKENLFHEDWLNVTKTTFLSFIKSSLKLK
jgi:hypothetical protein